MATACRQPLDDATLEFYHEALSREADAESWERFTLRAAGDGEFRDVTGTVWFPKLPDLREAYARERASAKVLPFARVPPPSFWADAQECDEYLAAVRANPKGQTEGTLEYIVRIAEKVQRSWLEPRTMPTAIPFVPRPSELSFEDRCDGIYRGRIPGEDDE